MALSQQANAAYSELKSPETKCLVSLQTPDICHCKAASGATSRKGDGQWVLQDKAEASTGFLPSSRLHLFLRIAWVCQGVRL